MRRLINRRKSTMCGLVVAVVFILGASMALAEPVVDAWRIPHFNILTGPYAFVGEEIRWVNDQALKDINAAGGAQGRPIIFEYRDSALDPVKSVAEMTKYVEKSLLMVGPIAGITVKAVMPTVIRYKALTVTPHCGHDVLMQFQPWVVGMDQPFDIVIPGPMKGWIEERPDIKTVAIILEPYVEVWETIADYKRKTFEEIGVEVLPYIEIPSQTVEFGATAIKALATKADGFIIITGDVNGGKILNELVNRGVTDHGRIMIYPVTDAPAMHEIVGDNIEGCYTWGFYNMASDNPKYLETCERYYEDHPDLALKVGNVFIPYDYDVCLLVRDALQNTGVTGDPAKLQEERDKLRAYMRNVKDFQGLVYTYDRVDGVPYRPGTLMVYKDLKRVHVKTYWESVDEYKEEMGIK